MLSSKSRNLPCSQHSNTQESKSTDADIQLVPTTPFIEQYNSPSLYPTNDTCGLFMNNSTTFDMKNLQQEQKLKRQMVIFRLGMHH